MLQQLCALAGIPHSMPYKASCKLVIGELALLRPTKQQHKNACSLLVELFFIQIFFVLNKNWQSICQGWAHLNLKTSL